MAIPINTTILSWPYDAASNTAREIDRMRLTGASQQELAELRSAYMQQEMQRAQMNAASNTIGQIASPFAAMANSVPRAQHRNVNTIGSMQMPLSALVDLWRAKYEDAWVDAGRPVNDGSEEDVFWSYALRRLRAAEKLEIVGEWMRIREDV